MACPFCENPNVDDGKDCMTKKCVRRRYRVPAVASTVKYNCLECYDNGYTGDGQLCGCTFCYLCVQTHENCKCETGSPRTGDIQFAVIR